MQNFLLPIILIGLSGALFLFWIDPTYDTVKDLQTEFASFDEAREKSAEIAKFRKEITDKYQNITQANFDRLEKVLPSHIDNIQLILDINRIADNNGMTIRDIRINKRQGAEGSGREAIQTASEGIYDTVEFSFSVVSTYENFKTFLDALAISLRVVDVTSVSISAISGESDFYRYDVGIKTYWLEAEEE